MQCLQRFGPAHLGGRSRSPVSGGENPHIDGGRFILDEHQGWQALGSRIVARLRVEGAAVLTAVQDASRRCAVPFGPP
jgi:hypothetical protein